MPNVINAEHGSSTAMTITLASLASSTSGIGRQSTMIDNTDNAQIVHVFYRVTTGTSPTDNRSIQFYLLQGDDTSSSNIRTDNAGASDAGLTVGTAALVHVAQTDNTSDKAYRGSFTIHNPGVEWGIAVVHDTGANLNSTGGNHAMRFVSENQEIQ